MASRRDQVPFDPYHFEKLARSGRSAEPREVFSDIYRRHHWAGSRSASGAGASADQTSEVRRVLPELLRELGVATMLDLPCGDYTWMRGIELPVARYLGGDLLPELIAPLAAEFGDGNKEFRVLDLTRDDLPRVDLHFCRDCLVHLSFADIAQALRNVARSDSTYLLTTTFPECDLNEDIVTGDWRVLNLERAPFHLPRPLRLVNEGCTEGAGVFADKSLGLWRIAELRKLPFLNS